MPNASGNSRDDFRFPAWRDPEMTSARLHEITKAATAFANRNASDPFAFGRIFLHMKRGIVAPAEVMADAHIAAS